MQLTCSRKIRFIMSMRGLHAWALGCLLLGATAAHAQFTFLTNNGGITITGSTAQGSVTIPSAIDGLPVRTVGNGSVVFSGSALTNVTIPDSVTSIGAYAFANSINLQNATIGNGVTSIGFAAFENCFDLTNVTTGCALTNIDDYAFESCSALGSVNFSGNAPAIGNFVFFYDDSATAYYLPGTGGWTSQLGELPTAFWVLPYPLILDTGASGTAPNRQIGFTVSWATNASVVVEACTNLLSPVWQPVQTNTLTSGSFPFSESRLTNYQGRFYRVRAQ
jgi:hypothetical protein